MIRAADVALSMCRVQDQDGDMNERIRRIQVQKIRDSEMYIEDMYMTWDVDKGNIHELSDYVSSSEY